MQTWQSLLSTTDQTVYQTSGQGQLAGFGKHLALLIIDMTHEFCGEADQHITDSVRDWPLSCGHYAWTALPKIRALRDLARQQRIPIVYTRSGVRSDQSDLGGWSRKNRRTGMLSPAQERIRNEIMPDIAPDPRDYVIEKLKPSAFFGTPLMSLLTEWRVDSLILAGTTTGGCVRATAVDAFSYNLNVSVVADACFDRYELSHQAALFDIRCKYGDVYSLEELQTALQAVESQRG